MLHSLDSLRHYPVIGRHHEDDDVRAPGATRPHRGKGRVARSIQEGNHAVVGFNVICADMLGNPAGLT